MKSLKFALNSLKLAAKDDVLDGIVEALTAAGARHVSIYLLTHKEEPAAQCGGCNKWFAIAELIPGWICPECGHKGPFKADGK